MSTVTLFVLLALAATCTCVPVDVANATGSEPRTMISGTSTEHSLSRFRAFGTMVKDIIGKFLAPPTEKPPEKIEDGFEVSCSMCSFAVNLLVSYVRTNKTEKQIADTAISICVTFNIESEMVCAGAINSLIKDIVYIIRNSPYDQSVVCGFALGRRCEDENFENAFNFSINFPVPEKPPVQPIVPPKPGQPTLRILHLSDTHLDPYYETGTNALCGAPLCCRQSVGMPSDPSHAAGKWGDYRKCDSPMRTIEHMLQHIKDTHELDMVFWTGDLPPHDVYNQTKKGNVNIIRDLTTLVKQYFPNTPVFPALGNHESEPVNCFPQPEIEGNFSISWLYDELSIDWENLLNKDIKSTVEKGAYYSVSAQPGLRIISLNMNYCNNKNWWLLLNNKDPANELQWLINELTTAEVNNEKVYLLGHIPPGHSDCSRIWSRNFQSIIERFENTIAAQFYGHTHFDELTLFFDKEYKRPINIAYIGSSTTPYFYLNPSYKIYTVDGEYTNSSRAVLDGETYYMNLTEANLLDKPEWKLLYSYKDAYNMENLTPNSWSDFLHSLKSDQTMNDKFFSHMHRTSGTFPPCDGECSKEVICRQIVAQSEDLTMCDEWGVKPIDGKLNRLALD